ncbi:Regulatory-Associated Protein Of Mtor [Manis pentadactyla]|nr:Regulatory-Associated Protein Of Mtor [Manis pentadactyla]
MGLHSLVTDIFTSCLLTPVLVGVCSWRFLLCNGRCVRTHKAYVEERRVNLPGDTIQPVTG